MKLRMDIILNLMLTPETMKLLGSTESKLTKDKNGENVPHLEVAELVIVHCNIINNNYHRDSRILYTFVPNKTFGSLLEISPPNHIFLKTFNSELQEIKVWFTNQTGQKLVDSAKKSATDALKTASKKAIQKTAEATGDLVGNNFLKIVKSLEDSQILLKGVSETIKDEAKEQKGRFLSMFLGTLRASFLGDLLIKHLSGKGVIRAGEGTIRAGYGSKRSPLKKF